MKKLILNEDLFELFVPEDIVEGPIDIHIPSADANIEVMEEETPSGPATGAETGIANQLIEMINGEWNTIADYNNLIAMLTQYGFEEFIPVIEDINNEENLHVGQLQALLQKISPNAESIQQGELEASSEQMNESLNEQYEQIDFNDFRSKLNGKEIEMLERFYDESDAFIYYDDKLDRYLIKDNSDEYGPYTLDELINDISYTIAEWDKLDN